MAEKKKLGGERHRSTPARQAVLHDINTAKGKLTKRLKRLEEYVNKTGEGANELEYMRNKYKRIVKSYKIPQTSTNKLKSLRRELERFEEQASTTSHGFKSYIKINQLIESYGLDPAEIYEAYDKLLEENKALINYKYEVILTMVEYKVKGHDDGSIRDRVMDIYDGLRKDRFTNWVMEARKYEKFYPL